MGVLLSVRSGAGEASQLEVEVLDRPALVEGDRVAPGAVRGDQALADHAAGLAAGRLDPVADRDAPRRRLHAAALPSDRLDVERPDRRVVRQLRPEAGRPAGWDLLGLR